MILDESKFPRTWEEFKSMADFIKSTPMNNLRFHDNQVFYSAYQEFVDKDTRMKILFTTFEGKDRVILRPSFPYDNLIKFLPKVTHYCLWSTNGPVSPQEVDQEIKLKFPTQDYFWFENDAIVKSIPEVWHCHIFVKED